MKKPTFPKLKPHHAALKVARRFHRAMFRKSLADRILLPIKGYSNDLITQMIESDKPCMVARLGSTELLCVSNYVGVKHKGDYSRIIPFVRSETPAWWWEPSMMSQMEKWSGFFPPNIESLEKFSEMMLQDMKMVDLLGSWCENEYYFKLELSGAKRVVLEDLEPFFTEKPWTWALKGKKVVVVHPFDESIRSQYLKRSDLFENQLLPEFSLRTVKAVQSLGGISNGFANWFEALEWMKNEIQKEPYDICILGCGAYGFPLAAHVKRQGKTAIHLGGVTQLLFGIKGKRWDDFKSYPYQNLYNNQWVRPGETERPKTFQGVENGCYW